jgi:hypothetical protein
MAPTVLPLHDQARGRLLPTTVYVPESGTSAPLIVFGHGMWGHPRKFRRLFARWVEAGYLVAAPAFPHTNDENQAFSRVGLGGMSAPAKVLAAIIVLGAGVFAVVAFALASVSDDPSSTASLIFLVMPIYAALAVCALFTLDWAIRHVIHVLTRR